MEVMYAASHLEHQYQALSRTAGAMKGVGADPKEVARILGLNLFKPPEVTKAFARSQSPRSIVTKRLRRNHPVAVAVNSRHSRR